jgi:carbamoyl-phosphate synthase large subunit
MKTSRTTVSVIVTGVGGGGNGEQIVKALRLAETPYEIVGTDMSERSSGLMAVDHSYVVPPATHAEYIPTLLKIAHRHTARALFPGSEPELKVLSQTRTRLTDAGLLLPLNPAAVIDLCMDKVRTAEALTQLGFRVPAFKHVRTVEDALTFPHRPAVLKPSVGGGGSANVFLVQDEAELAACAKQLLAVCDEVTVQAYVGSPDAEYTVGVLHDLDGQLLNSIAVRRDLGSALSRRIVVPNRTGRSDLGPTLVISSGISQGEVGEFPEVTRPCEQMAGALGARGPINIQCRFVDGEVLVFEINPRFSGTTSLRAMMGYNEPDILVRKHLLGQEIQPRFSYRTGTIMRTLQEVTIEPARFMRGADLP